MRRPSAVVHTSRSALLAFVVLVLIGWAPASFANPVDCLPGASASELCAFDEAEIPAPDGRAETVRAWVAVRVDEGAVEAETGEVGHVYDLAASLVAPSNAPGTAIRQVGRHLESVEDVFGNPQLLAGRGPGDVRSILNGSQNWVEGTMRHSTSAPNGGWTFRELTTDGSNFTGRYIQWHPGTPRHFGGDAYWKVSSGPPGTVRIPQ